MDSGVLFEDDVNKINEYLKVHPEDINIVVNIMTPLMHAVFYERIDVIDCLIEHGCDINFQNNYGSTALHFACDWRDISINRDIIERLIANGASGLLKNDYGNTALHNVAAFVNDVNIIHLLLIISDPNSINKRGRNPLMIGCQWNKNIEIISALINVTYDINFQDTRGQTALFHCCYDNNNHEAMKLLFSSGANPLIQNNNGKTPHDLANEEGKRIIDEYLASKK